MNDKDNVGIKPTVSNSELIETLGGKTAQQHCEDLKREAKQLLHIMFKIPEGYCSESIDRIVTCIVMASVLEVGIAQAETIQRMRRT